MIQIKDQRTLKLLHRIDADTLEDADLEGIYLRGANLVGMNCARANFRHAVLHEADMEGACLKGADLTDADLREAHLPGADLVDAILIDANLWAANLLSADLTNADLCGTILESATMVGVILEGARYDLGTQWPYRFLLHGHGLQLVVGARDALQAARGLIEESRRARRQARELQVEVIRAQLTWKVIPDPEE
jgi:Pentapeptide repeats (8 copies)